MRYVIHTLLASAALLVACGDSTGPDGSNPRRSQSFEWNGQIASGAAVEIKNVNGDIRAKPSADGTVRVVARMEGEKDDPSTVRIEVLETPQGVTICAVYPDVPGLPVNRCLPGLAGQLSSRNNDVSVTIEVEVPADCALVGRTVGGSVQAVGLTGDVIAGSVSGDIDISTSGVAEATTLDGDVTASIGQPDWDRNLAFTALNGHVTVRVPTETNADVWASTGSGSISTDFGLSVVRVGGGRSLRGQLGSGGRSLRITTTAGNIALRAN